MSLLVVGVAECRLSKDSTSALVTYALGSCIAVAIYDPVAKVGGLLHYMLPESSLDAVQARERPWMFADTGIPKMLEEAGRLGADKRRLAVWAVGGARLLDDGGVFNIGKRNCLALKKVLWKSGVMVHTEVLGGTSSRTVRLELSSGDCWLQEGTGAPVALRHLERRQPGGG